MTKNKTIKKDLGWKILSFFALLIIAILLIAFYYKNIEKVTEENNNNSTVVAQDKQQEIDFTFTGTDDDVLFLCDLELQELAIEYVEIVDPSITKTRVGTYELNGILRTPSNNPDMPQPRSTEMLCTIFPGDEDPVEITFGKDW